MSHYASDGDEAAFRTALDALDAREPFVECLADGTMWKRDLQDELGVSRSTVYKAIRELEAVGLVERRAEGYGLSVVGRRLFEQRTAFHERADAIYQSAPLLADLRPGVDVPSALLVDGEVVSAERFAPNRPVHVIGTLVGETTSLRGLSPVVIPKYVEIFHDELVSNDLQAELLLEAPVVDHLLAEYSRPFDEAIEAGDLIVHRTNETLPYGMLLLEGPTRRIVFIAYGPSGDLRGLIVNETPEAFEWGETEWQRHLSSAEPTGRATE